ncbi:hypothetical protein SCANM63S_05408 [Streptomyces canarius]
MPSVSAKAICALPGVVARVAKEPARTRPAVATAGVVAEQPGQRRRGPGWCISSRIRSVIEM